MICSSNKAKRTHNPIRNIVDNLNPPKNHAKKLLNLALGDPTVHGNLETPKVMNDAVQELLLKHSANGYIASVGLPEARRAIAKRDSLPNFPVLEDDVIIASGCSGALDLALTVLLNEGVFCTCHEMYIFITLTFCRRQCFGAQSKLPFVPSNHRLIGRKC